MEFQSTNTQDHIVFMTGFGRKGINDLARAMMERHNFGKIDVVEGCPPRLADKPPDELLDGIEGQMRSILESAQQESGKPPILVGHSYGALLALALVTIRNRLKDFFKVCLIDGPLNPFEEVSPPASGMFDEFRVQYENRKVFASRIFQDLRTRSIDEMKKLLTIGSPYDDIVPYRSKIIPGVPHVNLCEEDEQGHDLTSPRIYRISAIIMREVISATEDYQSSRLAVG